MKTALIGLGMVAATYRQALADTKPDIALKGVYARDAGKRQAFAASAQAYAYGSVEEIAADDELDFVILATPPNARQEIVARLVQASKPILMEKPVERDLKRAVHLCALAEAGGVPLGIVLQHRLRPSARKLREIASAQDLGSLMAVEISVPWWRPQSYYDEPGRGSYARDGGGVMISQAIHTLDLALSFTSPVTSVTALSATTGHHSMESEDFVVAGLRFADGAAGQFFATTSAYPGRTETIRFHFARVSITLEGSALTLEWLDGRRERFGDEAATGSGADPMAFTHEWHRMVIEDFAKALKDGRQPLVSGRDALDVHRIIDAISEAAQSGKAVEISGS